MSGSQSGATVADHPTGHRVTCSVTPCMFPALGTVNTADGHLELDLWPAAVLDDPTAGAAKADPDMLCRHHLLDEADRHLRTASGRERVA